METNQNPVQEQPAQIVIPETTATLQSEQPSGQPAPQIVEPVPVPATPLYNPEEAARIVKHLTNGIFNPEYILLFGSLVGGTPHSEIYAYDLLVVVRETPAYDWIQAKRNLRYMMPHRHREITYINVYVCSLLHVQTHNTPFLYYAHQEGELLYCREHFDFRRPKRSCDFAKAYCNAGLYFDTFFNLGTQFMRQAKEAMAEQPNIRFGAFATAQAAVYFYRTLYYVYHGEDFDSNDPVILHDRMRTLSTKLMILLDDNHIENIFTVPSLKHFLNDARYDLDFDIRPSELEMHMDRVTQMGKIVRKCCKTRLEGYRIQSQR